MKKLVLLFTAVLMSLTTVTASEKISDKKGKHLDITKRYRYAQPIVFVERGVEFLVFPDGSFDFNTNFRNVYNSDVYYRTSGSRRGSVNKTYGAPGKRVKYSRARSRGVSISHDYDGKVRRIGNVFLNYDRQGKIKRVGSIYLGYNHGNGRLKQVGGLRVNYNHWGEIVHKRGQVSPYSDTCGICGVVGCTTGHAAHNDYDNDRYEDDYNDDFYYYKKGGKVKKHKKNKRRK